MTFYILTLFPQMLAGLLNSSILKRAQGTKLITVNLVNPRDFARNTHKTVDDKPYGGGGGMILKVDILLAALESIIPKPYIILLSPIGKKYDQKRTKIFAKKQSLALICGHYEGVDARIENFADEVVSIGDFILTGGEIAAAVIVDSVARLIPEVIKKESLETESFSSMTTRRQPTPITLLEYPQYTRPAEFRGLKVPPILLSGDHQQIARWRGQQAVKRTKKWRPDLLKRPQNQK